MSTAKQATHRTTYATEDAVPLDQVIKETQRKQKGILTQASAYFQIPSDDVYDVLRHKWKTKKGEEPFSDYELFLGLCMVVKYDLDPMSKEIYLGRDKYGKLMIIVAIDGWIKIVHRSKDYDGHTQEMHFDEEGELEWVDTTIYSKTRTHPTVYRGYAKEYMRIGGFMKSSLPWHMLRLFSFRHAARFFAPIGGAVVTVEEARWMSEGTTTVAANAPTQDPTAGLTPVPPPEPPPEPDETVQTGLVERFVSRIHASGVTMKKDIDAILTEYRGGNDVSEATMGVLRTLAAERWKELRPPRGEESNAPKPAPSDPDPAIQASADNREKLLADIAGATPGGTLDIDDKARNLAETGDLTPDDHHTVMKASGARRLEAGGGE